LGVLLEQFPRTGAGHPDSRVRASPRILEPGQISEDSDIAMQNPTYAPRPAIWKLKDKIQIPNSETAVSVYAPALSLHQRKRDEITRNTVIEHGIDTE
jgi:hypothetical protein